MRPGSVVKAEWLYSAAIGLMLATSLMTFGAVAAAYGAGVAGATTALIVGFYLAATLLTTRAGSGAGLVLLMLGTVFAAGGLAWQLSAQALTPDLLGALNVAQVVLMIAGAVLLFRPDARAWRAGPNLEEPA